MPPQTRSDQLVKTLESRSEILRRAKNLTDGSFKWVYISPDLTRRQQEVDKDLRQKLKSFREGSEPNARIRGEKLKTSEGGEVMILFEPPK